MKKNSIKIIKDFLEASIVDLDAERYLSDLEKKSNDLDDLPNDIVKKIIGDAYAASSGTVKKISELLSTEYDIFLGRVQKEQLKKYLDYGYETDFQIFVQLLRDETKIDNLRNIIDELASENEKNIKIAVAGFFFNLQNALRAKDDSRVKDYLVFIYSRLLAMNEKRNLSLQEIFNDNARVIRKELSPHAFQKLYDFCASAQKEPRFDAINKFNSEYLKILDQNGNKHEKSALVYLNVTQNLYDKCGFKKKFYSSLFSFIKQAYETIENHKSLVIKIENIIVDGINIKWELYSCLTIFAEKFNKIEEKRQYYFPETICKDFLKQKYKIKLSAEDVKALKDYYDGTITYDKISKLSSFKFPNAKETIDDFKYIYTGFTFIDCVVLQSNKKYANSSEIEFIENNNEILLIFIKHKIDDRKIPCPICASLKISGNSFPEIGIRSWECKNPTCSERSKTNRGKRYSVRTIFMQSSNFDFSPENTTPKNILSRWRKDIVERWDLESLYKMITKYYSYVSDTITTVNAEDPDTFSRIVKSEKRFLKSYEYDEFVGEVDYSLFDSFFEPKNFSFVSHFIDSEGSTYDKNPKLTELLDKNKFSKIIFGDCLKVLESVEPKSIANMVTSPPYYNAREYSQWENIYQYLYEMYHIIQKAYDVLREGGVFFFNIGDIFDNERIIVKSKMGEKRIPLGAYTILLFKKVGFEILDNVIWNKGEPQSNRHKNDGNFTPYYQRPANCYEHIFIFKKPGKKLQLNSNTKEIPIRNNIQRFIPVYKIGAGGINKFGHSAPFPHNIPLMSVLSFTNVSEITLDPFSGSGTSAIVATANKRIGIGIEILKEFVDLSVQKAKKADLDIEVIHFESGSTKSYHSKTATLEKFIPNIAE